MKGDSVKEVLLSIGLCALLASPCLAASNPDPKPFLLSLQALPAADALASGQSSLVYEDGSCFVTRYCAYPPPESVSCFSQAGNCVLGSDFVWCDGVYHRCSTQSTLPDCFTLNGTSCSPNGTQTDCSSDGLTNQCTCFRGSWSCPY
jgi:hypothetical protein